MYYKLIKILYCVFHINEIKFKILENERTTVKEMIKFRSKLGIETLLNLVVEVAPNFVQVRMMTSAKLERNISQTIAKLLNGF